MNSQLRKYLLPLVFVLSITLLRLFTIHSDQLPVRISGSSNGDAMGWTESSRTRVLDGQWYRDIDDWRPIFIVPLHSVVHWLTFKAFGLNLLGHRFAEVLLVGAVQLLLLLRIPQSVTWPGRILLSCIVCFSGVFLAFSRQATMDTLQVMLFFLGICSYASAFQLNRKRYWILGSVLLTVASLYKISALLILTMPLVLPAVYNRIVAEEDWSRIFRRANFLLSGSTMLLLAASYVIFWMIPNLDDTVYFAWRMFGSQGQIVMPWNLDKIVRNVLYLFSSPWGPGYDVSIRFFHGSWVICLLLGFPYLLLNVIKAEKKDAWGLLLVTSFPVLLLQIVLFDMQWRRYFLLAPLSFALLLKLVEMLRSRTRIKPDGKSGIAFVAATGFGFYQLLSKYLFNVGFDGNEEKLGIAALAVISLFLAWFLVASLRSRIFPGGLAVVLAVTLPLFFLDTVRGINELLFAPKSLMSVGKEVAGLGNRIRIIPGISSYHLYHDQESFFTGTMSGAWKPDGYRDKHGNTIQDMLRAHPEDGPAKVKYSLLRLFEGYYPGFAARWYLPPDYRERYKSSLIFDAPGHFSSRHLLIGFDEALFLFKYPTIPYITDQALERVPSELYRVFTVRDPAHSMESIFDIRLNKMTTVELHRLKRADARQL
jgi:hypothetical protein